MFRKSARIMAVSLVALAHVAVSTNANAGAGTIIVRVIKEVLKPSVAEAPTVPTMKEITVGEIKGRTG